MNRRINIVNNIISIVLTVTFLILVVKIADRSYFDDFGTKILYIISGVLISYFVSTFFHELGHVIAGVKNGFNLLSFKILFLIFIKKEKGFYVSFSSFFNESGRTELVPTKFDNLADRFKKTSKGGLIASFVVMLIGIPPLFLTKFLSTPLFFIWAMNMPIGAYFFFDNALPMTGEGYRNDGAMICGIKSGDDECKVIVALLRIQGEMFLGKTPSEIDEELYFNLPQLMEDSPYFINLLNARYNYYLDKGDYVNAVKTTERLLTLTDYMTKSVRNVIYSDALYNACTFDFDEDKADDYSYEVEDYLNKSNTFTNLRIKLAYILYVRREKVFLYDFYSKAKEEADKCLIKGLSKYEIKLLNKLKEDFDK